MQTKTCTICGKDFPATSEYFYVRKDSKDGLRNDCKECRKNHTKEYSKDNKEKVSEYGKQYREQNKEKMKDYKKQYYENNNANILENNKKWKEDNKEYYKNQQKEYRKENKEVMKEWRKNNKEYIAENMKKWQKQNLEKCRIIKQRRRAKIRKLPCDFTEKDWILTKEYFNNKCAYCGQELPLEQEHFISVSNNGGYTKDNIIPACKHCNCSKNDKDFFEWYPTYEFYDKKREEFLLEYLRFTYC